MVCCVVYADCIHRFCKETGGKGKSGIRRENGLTRAKDIYPGARKDATALPLRWDPLCQPAFSARGAMCVKREGLYFNASDNCEFALGTRNLPQARFQAYCPGSS